MSRVMVMNEKTWEKVKDELTNNAMNNHDPIGYISMWGSIDVIIDNELPIYYVEVYENREFYEAVLKYGRLNTYARDVE